MPVEVNEAITPVVFWRKELRPSSGGDGTYRGGHGQLVELASLDGVPFTFSATYERTVHPARGREGGGDGRPGELRLLGRGEPVKPIGQTEVPAGERLLIAFPGGGGFGPPEQRSAAAIEAEVRAGLVDGPERAAGGVGVEVRPKGGNGQTPARG